jgi:hypothetical protein
MPSKYETNKVLPKHLLPPGAILLHQSEERRLKQDVADGNAVWNYACAEIAECMVEPVIAPLASNKFKSGSTAPPTVYGAMFKGFVYTSLAPPAWRLWRWR